MPIIGITPVPIPLSAVVVLPTFLAKAKPLVQASGIAATHVDSFVAPDQGDTDGLSVMLLDWPAAPACGAWLWDDTTGQLIGWIESGRSQTGGIPVGHRCHLEIVAPDGHSWSLKVSG